MAQPLDRHQNIPALGKLDRAAGEIWVNNPFKLPSYGENLSAFEKNRLFINVAGRRFVDASFASGADIDSDSRSVVVGDFDGDGRPDLLVANVGGGPLRLFLNQFPTSAHRVRVELVGTESNRTGIGTRVTAHCGDRQIVRDLFPTNAFMGQSPPELILGVGEASSIDRLTLRWPTGKIQEFENVPAVGHIRITEGSSQYEGLHTTPAEANVGQSVP